jgi:general transcription factor 3C protein 4
VQRVVVQCMLPGAPNDLSVEAQNLANKVTTLFPPAEHDGMSNGLQERCPACGVEVLLTDIAVAACSNGHRWREYLMTSDMRPLTLLSRWSRGGPPHPF